MRDSLVDGLSTVLDHKGKKKERESSRELRCKFCIDRLPVVHKQRAFFNKYVATRRHADPSRQSAANTEFILSFRTLTSQFDYPTIGYHTDSVEREERSSIDKPKPNDFE